jgi:hypothetical protein
LLNSIILEGVTKIPPKYFRDWEKKQNERSNAIMLQRIRIVQQSAHTTLVLLTGGSQLVLLILESGAALQIRNFLPSGGAMEHTRTTHISASKQEPLGNQILYTWKYFLSITYSGVGYGML